MLPVAAPLPVRLTRLTLPPALFVVAAEVIVAVTVSAPSNTVSPTGSTLKLTVDWPAGMLSVKLPPVTVIALPLASLTV